MKIDDEDIRWLQEVRAGRDADVPPFNRSRLITLCLVEELNGGLVVNIRGEAAIVEHRPARNRPDRRFRIGA